ncbi:sulfatase-like hydrolase/transferase [Acidobacteriota bacterium]
MEKKLTKKQKKYLRGNFRQKSDVFMAKRLGLSEKSIRRALKQLDLKRTKEEQKVLNYINLEERETPKSRVKIFSTKSVLVVSALIVVLIFFFGLYRFLALEKDETRKEARKILLPLEAADLNVLFISLDTLRADHLGCYGYEGIETPNIDQLAREGILFKNATCQIPLTLPSHSSIFTGTHPAFHGVRDNSGFYLESDKVTLAEVMKEHGWTASAFIGAFVLDSRWGLDQGIDYYYDNFDFTKYKTITLDSVQREGGEVIEAFFEWLDKNHQQRFFSWLHLYDPHTPYDPPEPYKTQYSDKPWGLYDGEIAYVDSLIGKILDNLSSKKILDKTIIVIVGDHGESLGEHAEGTHGFFIYDACVSVPLIFHFPFPKLRGSQVEAQVETTDIMPTLLEILDLPIPEDVQGKSLLPLILGQKEKEERFGYSESYYPLYHYGWSELKSLRSIRFKYIQAPRPELYDLVRDPGEKNNIYKQNSSVAAEFQAKLDALEEKFSSEGIEEKGPQKLDEETVEKLRALGYIGGFTSRSKLDTGNNRADPKDKIHLYRKIKMAQEKFAEKIYDEALEEINKVIEEDSRVMEALQVRSRIYLKMNRNEEAIADSKAALKIDPEYEAAIFNLALAYKNQKKYDEAIAGYTRLKQMDPRDYRPYFNLGDIYLEKKEFDKAIPLLKKAIEIQPGITTLARVKLGAVYMELKEFDLAEAEFLKALEIRPRMPDAHYNLALLYEEKNEFLKAVEEYKKEIELYAASHDAHFNLGKIYEKMENREKQIEHFRESIKYRPDFANGHLFLAKAYLDSNENLDDAIRLARKGIQLAPQSEYAPLGHFILADIYNRLGQTDKYNEELKKGRQLQEKLKKAL